jgi:hypothetical protein
LDRVGDCSRRGHVVHPCLFQGSKVHVLRRRIVNVRQFSQYSSTL